MPSDLSPIPFGSQYYRAPTPVPQDWERDIVVMKDTGLDCVKLWLQWRWNHPGPDQMDFTDLSRICDLAGKHGLKVVLNSILDIAPAWLYDLHPDAYMVTCGGRLAHSQVTACRQVGGSPGPCYHHEGAWQRAWSFLAEAARHFAGHPAVWGWDVWNEPELSMVHRYTCENGVENMVCYCESTRAAFAQWLLKRYGSLEAINEAHGRNYQRVEQIECPRWAETYRDFIDWRLFFCDTLADNMRHRAEIIRRHAPNHRVVTHTVPPVALTITNAANDEWKLAAPVEEFGASFPLYAPLTYEMDMNRSAAKGKRLWSAEFYPGTGNNPSVTPRFEARLRQLIFLPLFHGYKAYLIWQWRGERLGREGGWGRHAGLPQPEWPAIQRLKSMVSVLRAHGPWLKDAQPQAPRTAMLFNPEAELYAYCWAGRSQFYQDSMVGMHQALEAANLPLHFVHPMEVTAGKLADYRVLVMPFPTWVAPELAEAIRTWVQGGGTLVAEAHFAGRDPTNGLTWDMIPGLGFDQVFGAEQARFRTRGKLEAQAGAPDVAVTTQTDLPFLPAGSHLVGAWAAEFLRPTTAEVLATHEDGSPAITRNRFGQGQAILIGTFLGAAYRRSEDADARGAMERLMLSLLPPEVEQDRPMVQEGPARVRTLGDGQRQWLYVENLADAERTIRLSLPGDAPAGTWKSVLDDGARIELSQEDGRRSGAVTLPGGGIGVFAAE